MYKWLDFNWSESPCQVASYIISFRFYKLPSIWVLTQSNISVAKTKWSTCQERVTEKKVWVPDRIRTYDLPNTGRALYIHLSYGELVDSEALYKVNFWHASCILLGSAMSMSHCMVKEWNIVVNFKLGETNVKTKWSACHERGTKKISESQTTYIYCLIYILSNG